MGILSAAYSALSANIETVQILLGIGSALMAGVFFAFSSFVMTALDNLKPGEGIKAMQRINIDVFCWSFMSLFFVLPVAFVTAAVVVLQNTTVANANRVLIAAVVYLVGVFAVTMFGNVPLNNALARVDVATSETGKRMDESSAGIVWRNYVVVWRRWNHVRTFAGLAASLVLLC